MTKKERNIVYKAIEKFGDDFWTETVEDSNNKYLFDDIEKYVLQAGYKLQLVKVNEKEAEKLLSDMKN